MLRSFATLSRTLNLTQTVEILGNTRQTVRRHIKLLEELKGVELLERKDNRYFLTEAGKACLVEAEIFLKEVDAWITGRVVKSTRINGLDHLTFHDNKGAPFYAQQHPITHKLSRSLPLLKEGYKAWTEAAFEVEHLAMSHIKPYLVIYKKYQDTWFIAHIGDKSGYAIWMGWEWVKSAIGRPVTDSPTSPEMTRFVSESYSEVLELGTARLDHIYTHMKREKGAIPQPISYQRLIFTCRFPDESFGVASLVGLTNKIDITQLDSSKTTKLPEELLMEFVP